MDVALIVFSIVNAWLLLSDPYMPVHFFKKPYSTWFEDGAIRYKRNYKLRVSSWKPVDLLGYYKSGVLVLLHRLRGPRPLKGASADRIIWHIHQRRFNEVNPFLISGDQFSVLYPRNLGVFYNQLLNPDIALSDSDWLHKQEIYLQSVLIAVDALSAGKQPYTTIVPLGRRTVSLTQVHPGDIASDAVYGLLFAIDKLASEQTSKSGRYVVKTTVAAQKLLKDKRTQLTTIVEHYVDAVRGEDGLIDPKVHLASARDGVTRSSSFYDNVVLWKTLELAQKYRLYKVSKAELKVLKQAIDQRYWDEEKGYYRNALNDDSFSSDWLIGYVVGFFTLNNQQDLTRAKRIVSYIERNKIDQPLPIKYQAESRPSKAPFFVRWFVSNYGTTTIWSYWGSEYITLLLRLAEVDRSKQLLKTARRHLETYEKKIVELGCFPETFDERGDMFVTRVYKSIMMTGWVVQYEYAQYLASTISLDGQADD